MKAVILAGGYGTRLAEESAVRPKPMVEIGGRPILWHIMKGYSAHGIRDFVVCLGYKGYVIKEYFTNYVLHTSDITIDLADNRLEVHQNQAEPWRVTMIDTGEDTLTGGRLKRVAAYLDDSDFCFTYGDGVADVDIGALIRHHQRHKALATLTAVRQPGRFGSLKLDRGRVEVFCEKPVGGTGWINGGFFVVSPAALKRIKGDQSSWETDVLTRLAADGKLAAYKHTGFWQPMDTLREKNLLEQLWASGNAPWRVW